MAIVFILVIRISAWYDYKDLIYDSREKSGVDCVCAGAGDHVIGSVD